MKDKITTDQYINIAKIAGVGIGAYLLFKKNGIFSSILDTFKDKTTEEVEESTTTELNDLKKKGITPSYGVSQYVLWADQIFNAVVTSNPFNPTDEEAIYRVFGLMKNIADIILLIKSFGVRRLEFSTKGASLSVHLQEDLTQKEIIKLNKILSDKNINYRF